jgi:hypothetical protein
MSNDLKIGAVVCLVIVGLVFLAAPTIKLVSAYYSYVLPSSAEPNGSTRLYTGQGELRRELFIECLNTANSHQSNASSLSTTESETSELVEECNYYAAWTARAILESQ